MLADEDIKYHCRGFETCPKTGREHWQGVFNTWKRIRPSQIRKWFLKLDPNIDPPYYIEASWANNSREAVAYCKKCGEFEDDGVFVEEAGQRTDLDNAISHLKTKGYEGSIEGSSFFKEYSNVYVKYHKGIDKLMNKISKFRDFMGNYWFMWGVTEIGKTSCIIDKFGISNIFFFDCQEGKWWDGYLGQKVILIDDYRCGLFNERFLLRLLDRTPFKVPVKGDFIDITSEYIIFTSNQSYDEAFSNISENGKPALYRRFCKVCKWDTVNNEWKYDKNEEISKNKPKICPCP